MASQTINIKLERNDRIWVQMNSDSRPCSVYNALSAIHIGGHCG